MADEEFGCVCFNGFDLIGVEVLLLGLLKFDLAVAFVGWLLRFVLFSGLELV